jgi:hypothetical protein
MDASPTTVIRTISILMISLLCACSAGQSDKHAEKKLAKQEKKLEKEAKHEARSAENGTDQAATNGDVSRFAATGCDESMWSHVYNPTRLQNLAPCVALTGTVEESNVDDDGDQHFLLKLDAGQDAFVNKTNDKKKKGDLVVEIVCANPVSLPKAKSACAGYTNGIAKPAVGAHVKAIGSYVIDSHNGWTEIHPVTKLQLL